VAQTVGTDATAMLPDFQGALDSATAAKDAPAIACLTPVLAIIKAAAGTVVTPAVPAVPANPNATPPVAAVPAVPAVMSYPGPVTLFQKIREFGLAGGVPSCKSVGTTTVAIFAPIQ
jgi:hypothetical protein